MTSAAFEQTINHFRSEPEKARGRPTVTARSVGATAEITAGTFTLAADLPPALGGSNEAPSPTALLLSALAGCAVVFVRDTLAPQLGIRTTSVEATVSCEADARGLLALDGVSPDLTALAVSVAVSSPDGPEAVARLEEAWKQRCPIYRALIQPTPVGVVFTGA